MFVIMAILTGAIYAVAFYLMLARTALRLIFGLLLLAHAANLLIFTAGGLLRARPAIVPPGADAPPPGYADPIPQALILTAIVIGFAVMAFLLSLLVVTSRQAGTLRTEELALEAMKGA